MKGSNVTPQTPRGGVELISYRGEIVATAGARRIYVTPSVQQLDDADPFVMFVSLMGAYALQVRDDPDVGPYTDERAERFARVVLIDDDEFRMLDANELEDRLIAGHFGVPVEQIEEKRRDLRDLADRP